MQSVPIIPIREKLPDFFLSEVTVCYAYKALKPSTTTWRVNFPASSGRHLLVKDMDTTDLLDIADPAEVGRKCCFRVTYHFALLIIIIQFHILRETPLCTKFFGTNLSYSKCCRKLGAGQQKLGGALKFV
jgi:hypothetical protein